MMLFALLTLAMALGPLVWIVGTRFAGLRQWLAASSAATAMSFSALLVGPWVLLSVYARPAVVVAMLVALIFTGYRASRLTPPAKPRALPSTAHRDRERQRLTRQWASACVFSLIILNALAGRRAPSGTTDLHFPLKDGAYAVLQGGNSVTTNPFHHWFPSDHYGLDLVKVNALGNRARSLVPAQLNDYASYEVAVHSPCAGIVEEVLDHLRDNAPGETDVQHLTGNHVRLRCGGLQILLAHLRQGSVAVAVGESVRQGQLVGRIGNSGNTQEPHLHVSAVATESRDTWPHATGVPIAFDGRFLVINDVVR